MTTIRFKHLIILLLMGCSSVAIAQQQNVEETIIQHYTNNGNETCCATKSSHGLKNPAIMGVLVEDATNNSGALVSTVYANSGAAKSDLVIKDVITKVEDAPIQNATDLINALARYNPNDKVKVTFVRGDKTKTTKVILQAPEKTDDLYYNLSKKDDVTIVRLKQGDFEKLLEGNLINLPVAEANSFKADNEISIQLDNDVTIDCPNFTVIITRLDDTAMEQTNNNDPAIDMAKMTDLEVINLNLYPNPNDGLFGLNFRLNEKATPVLVRIVSIGGKEVYRENITDFKGTYDQQINIAENAAGVYVLQVVQGDKMMTRKLIIE